MLRRGFNAEVASAIGEASSRGNPHRRRPVRPRMCRRLQHVESEFAAIPEIRMRGDEGYPRRDGRGGWAFTALDETGSVLYAIEPPMAVNDLASRIWSESQNPEPINDSR